MPTKQKKLVEKFACYVQCFCHAGPTSMTRNTEPYVTHMDTKKLTKTIVFSLLWPQLLQWCHCQKLKSCDLMLIHFLHIADTQIDVKFITWANSICLWHEHWQNSQNCSKKKSQVIYRPTCSSSTAKGNCACRSQYLSKDSTCLG